MTDQEFKEKVNNSPLTRLYEFIIMGEVEKLFRKNAWKYRTKEREQEIDDFKESLKPAFIAFSQTGINIDNYFGNLEKLQTDFSKFLIVLERRPKIEKLRSRKKRNNTI